MEPMTVAEIGSLASGIKRKRLAPPRKANTGGKKKGGTRKRAEKKGAKDVASKKKFTQCISPNVDHPM
jgi:hypothetical protein